MRGHASPAKGRGRGQRSANADDSPESPLSKWNFAIGTTSRVPGSSNHYLILDIDNKINKPFFAFEYVLQETGSGWHVYTAQQIPNLSAMLNVALYYGADPVWCSIAAKRGYAFLADKSPVELPWPVERMIIGK